MAIEIEREPDEYFKETGVIERCFFCDSPTKYWHMRTNNPVCPRCAEKQSASSLPNWRKAKEK